MDFWSSKLIDFSSAILSGLLTGLVFHYLDKVTPSNNTSTSSLNIILHIREYKVQPTPANYVIYSKQNSSSQDTVGYLALSLIGLVISIVLYATYREQIILWGWRLAFSGFAFTLSVIFIYWFHYREVHYKTIIMLLSWATLFILLYIHQFPPLDNSYFAHLNQLKQSKASAISFEINGQLVVSQILGIIALMAYFISLIYQVIYLFISMIVLPRHKIRPILLKLPYPFKKTCYLVDIFLVFVGFFFLTGYDVLLFQKFSTFSSNLLTQPIK